MLVKALKEITLESVSISGVSVTRDFYHTGDIISVSPADSLQLIADAEAVAYLGTNPVSTPYKSETLSNPAAGNASLLGLPVDSVGVLTNDGSGTLTWSAAGGSGGAGNTSVLTDNGDGTFTHNDGTGVLTTFNGAPDTLTSLAYNTVTKMLTYTDEALTPTLIDLSALAADIYVNSATFNATSGILTLSDTSSTTPLVNIDISALRSIITDNLNKTYTHNDGSGALVVIDARADSVAVSPAATDALGSVGVSALKAREDHKHPAQGVSADLTNNLSIGTDGLHFFSEAVTALVWNPTLSTLTYTDEAGFASVIDISGVVKFATAVSPAATDAIGLVGVGAKVAREDHKHPAQGVSADITNNLSIGTDGLHFFSEAVTALVWNPATGSISHTNETGTTITSNLSMVGSNGVTPGAKGVVPIPGIADNLRFLRGDGTWQAESAPYQQAISLITPTAGLYSLTVAAAAHGVASPTIVQVWELIAGVYSLVSAVIKINATNDVIVEATSPLTGRIVIT